MWFQDIEISISTDTGLIGSNTNKTIRDMKWDLEIPPETTKETGKTTRTPAVLETMSIEKAMVLEIIQIKKKKN